MSIKKVKRERYDINRGKCGSPDIYEVEYKCTRVEIEQTTTSITAVKLSKRKPQFTKSTPTVTQGKTKHSKSLAKKTTSKKNKRDKQKEKKTQSVEKKGTALCPRKRPKKPLTRELNSGKNRIIMLMLLHKKNAQTK